MLLTWRRLNPQPPDLQSDVHPTEPPRPAWEMSLEEFQDGCHGGHLRYRNRVILAILNLHVATMPPTMCQLNPTHGSGDVENVKS